MGEGLSKEGVIKLVFFLLTLIFFLWIAATSPIQGKILGVVILALVLWSIYPKRHLISSLFVIALLSIFEVSISPQEFIDSLLSTYGGSGLWIIISGFILSEGMESSGLAKRIALWIVTGLGADPNKIILSVAIASFAISPLSPSTTAKAFLMLPICNGLIRAFDVKKGESRYGAAVMIMAMAANNICSTAFLNATVPNPISASYIRNASNVDLGRLEWFQMALPLTLILLFSSWLLCSWMFKPEVKPSKESLERIREFRNSLGSFDSGEVLVTVLFSFSLILWITERFHGLNAGLISLFISLLLFAPKIGVIKMDKFAKGVPYGSITLFAASMFLSKGVGRWGALDPVAESIFNFFSLSRLSLLLFISLAIILSMLLHVVFTSTTVYATVIVPLSISLAGLQGLDPQTLAIPIAFLTPFALILPVNTIPNVIFHSSGYFTQRHMVIYGVLTSLLSAVLIIIAGLPYWAGIGLINI